MAEGEVISKVLVIVAARGATVPLPSGVDWQVERVDDGVFAGFRVTDPAGKEITRLVRFVDPLEFDRECRG